MSSNLCARYYIPAWYNTIFLLGGGRLNSAMENCLVYPVVICGQNRVSFNTSVRPAPRTPSDWPTLASTRRKTHFCGGDPILATQPSKRYTIIIPDFGYSALEKVHDYCTPLAGNGRAVRPRRPKGLTRSI